MSAVPRVTRFFLAAAIAIHLALLTLGKTSLACSVLFGALTSALNLLALAWIVRGLARSAEGGPSGSAVAFAPLKFVGVIAVVLFFLSRPWIDVLPFLMAHGAVLFGVTFAVALVERREPPEAASTDENGQKPSE